MADKVTKWTMEARNLQTNIIEDIFKRVNDLKQIAKELEAIARQLKEQMHEKVEREELVQSV